MRLSDRIPWTRCVVCGGKVRPSTSDACQLRDGRWVDSGACWEVYAEDTAADLLETAWAVIANAGWSNTSKSPGWEEAAVRWRDRYHTWLDRHLERQRGGAQWPR